MTPERAFQRLTYLSCLKLPNTPETAALIFEIKRYTDYLGQTLEVERFGQDRPYIPQDEVWISLESSNQGR